VIAVFVFAGVLAAIGVWYIFSGLRDAREFKEREE